MYKYGDSVSSERFYRSGGESSVKLLGRSELEDILDKVVGAGGRVALKTKMFRDYND